MLSVPAYVKTKMRLMVLVVVTGGLVLTGTVFFSTDIHAAGNTLRVPSQYPTIQAAVNAAQNGDTIMLAPGTYNTSTINITKYITITSSGNSGNTTIQVQTQQPVLVWQNVPFTGGIQAKLENVTINNGHSNQSGQAGGITLANGADVQLSNVVIENSYSSTNGGGMIIYNSDPVLSSVTFSNDNAAQLGGGALIVNSNPTVYNSIFSSNTANEAGGGLWVDNGSEPVIVNSTFTSNAAHGGYGQGEGGAIGMRTGVGGVIEDSMFNGNGANYGGAIDLETQGGAPQIIANTFTNNQASYNASDSGAGFGGAIAVYNGTDATIEGNVIYNNNAYAGGAGIVVAENASPTIEHNDIYNNYAHNNDGGGLYIANASASLTNNCFLGNVGQIGANIASLNGSSVTSTNNTIINGSAIRKDLSWITGGVYVNTSSTTYQSSSDLIANNSGPQIYDEESNGSSVGTYVGDDIYTGSSPLLAYGTSSVSEPSDLSQVTNPPFRNNSLASFAPQFTDINDGQCTTPSGSQSSDYGQPDAPSTQPEPIYRFFGTAKQTHFFTASQSERNGVLAVQPVDWYHYEGIGFYAYSTQVAGTEPVYRFFQLNSVGSHFYTANQAEYQNLVSNESSQWQYEGIAFYAYPPNTVGDNQVCRFVNLQNGSHFYTADANECSYVKNSLGNEWSYEGIVFSVLANAMTNVGD